MDIRIDTKFYRHPKRVKLKKQLGLEGPDSLVCLWIWAAENKPDGNLSGMDMDDIEIAAEWNGTPNHFVECLVDLKWLDEDNGNYSLHDWIEHNPWVCGSETRSNESRFTVMQRWYPALAAELESHGVNSISQSDYEKAKASKSVKFILDNLSDSIRCYTDSNTDGIRGVYVPYTDCNTPFPLPYPLPKPIPKDIKTKEKEMTATPSKEKEKTTAAAPLPPEVIEGLDYEIPQLSMNVSRPVPRKKRNSQEPYTEEYNQVYQAYPRHEDKRKGFEQFCRLGDSKAAFMLAVKAYSAKRSRLPPEEQQYTKKLYRFIADSTWEDWVDGAPRAPGTNPVTDAERAAIRAKHTRGGQADERAIVRELRALELERGFVHE